MKHGRLTFGLGVILFFGFFGCEDPNYPEDIWEPDYKANPDPIITAIDPVDDAFAGVGIVKITGSNFSAIPGENIAYFNGLSGTMLEATETELTVKTANVVSDSVEVKVSVVNALLFGELGSLYSLSPAAIKYGPFDRTNTLWAIGVDSSENLYVSESTPNQIVKITPDNPDSTQMLTNTYSIKASGMSVGDDGSVHFVNLGTYLYIVPPEGGTNWSYIILPGNARDLDIASNGDIYAGGSSQKLFKIPAATGNPEEVYDYTNLNIVTVRTDGEYVYVLTTHDSTGKQNIWKHTVTGDSLTNRELVLNWSEYTGGDQSSILCLEIDPDGYLYIGSDKKDGPLIVIRTDGSAEDIYTPILSPSINYMAWGAGDYLYAVNITSETTQILRIEMIKSEVPHYGRP